MRAHDVAIGLAVAWARRSGHRSRIEIGTPTDTVRRCPEEIVWIVGSHGHRHILRGPVVDLVAPDPRVMIGRAIAEGVEEYEIQRCFHCDAWPRFDCRGDSDQRCIACGKTHRTCDNCGELNADTCIHCDHDYCADCWRRTEHKQRHRELKQAGLL